MPLIYPFMPDRNIYSSSKISLNTGNSLSKISENLVPMGESRRDARAYKIILFKFPTEEKEAIINRDPQKITIHIPFEKNELHIEITNKNNNVLQVEMEKNGKPMGELCGNLVIENNSITIVNEKEKKSIKLESSPDNTIKITDKCFDPGAYIIFKATK